MNAAMNFPWLEFAVLLPVMGALVVAGRRPDTARHVCVTFAAITLAATLGAWIDFANLHQFEAHDGYDGIARLFGRDPLVVDELSAPLLPALATVYLLVALSTLRTKNHAFSYARLLLAEALLVATFACKETWLLAALLIAGAYPALAELRERGRAIHYLVLHQSIYSALLVLGLAATEAWGPGWATLPIVLAIAVRVGLVPFHGWVTELHVNATFGGALLFTAPLTGVYAATRLVLPVASDEWLHLLGQWSLATALYAALMTLVQRDARRFFAFLRVSLAALVMAGVSEATPLGLTSGLTLWLSAMLALAGLGLTLRSLEARVGRLSLVGFSGLYEHVPTHAACFLVAGLACVGFPGTIGFVGAELLVDSAVEAYPYLGVAVVLASALNGIALLKVYFALFGGSRPVATVAMGLRRREAVAAIAVLALILGGGLVPQPGVASRYHAAIELLRARAAAQAAPHPELAPGHGVSH